MPRPIEVAAEIEPFTEKLYSKFSNIVNSHAVVLENMLFCNLIEANQGTVTLTVSGNVSFSTYV